MTITHWNMFIHSSVMCQCSKYHRKVQGTERGQVYFSNIQCAKSIGKHGGVFGEHF